MTMPPGLKDELDQIKEQVLIDGCNGFQLGNLCTVIIQDGAKERPEEFLAFIKGGEEVLARFLKAAMEKEPSICNYRYLLELLDRGIKERT